MLDRFTGVNSLNFHNCAFYYYFTAFTHFSLSLSLSLSLSYSLAALWSASDLAHFKPVWTPFTSNPCIVHSAVSQAETCSEFKPCTVHKVVVSFTRCHCSAAAGFQNLGYRMDTVAPLFKDSPNSLAHLVLKRGVVLSRVHLHGKARCVCVNVCAHVYVWCVCVNVCVCMHVCVCMCVHVICICDVCVSLCVCVWGGGGPGGQCVCVCYGYVCVLAHIYCNCVLFFALQWSTYLLNLEKQHIEEYNIIMCWKKWPSKWQGWSFFIRLLFCQGLHCLLSLYTTDMEVITKWKWSLD